ncbi:hypothetical protein AB0H23_32585 [Streptomyces albogriseolus]|uniref:hypothetical protein n=1 Tax=Streptomyces albogriseolus TaxID=1887 RepID=UPI00345FFCFA
MAYRIDRVLAPQERHSDEIAGARSDMAHQRRERLAWPSGSKTTSSLNDVGASRVGRAMRLPA